MNLLVVGGTGVLSKSVVKEALDKGFAVTLINRGNRAASIPAGAELLQADIRDSERLGTMLEGRHFDAVIDFLCYNRDQISHSLELFHGIVNQYVFVSTACVYDTSTPGIKDENAPKGFKNWNYSTDKWESEQYLIREAIRYELDYTIIRPCITYDDTRIPYGLMPPYGFHWTLAARILRDKPVITWDGGAARWSMMRVEDFAVGVIGLLGNPAAYGQAFNICGDETVSWNEVLDTLGKILGKEVKIFDIPSKVLMQYCPDRAGEIAGRAADAVIDNHKIKQAVPDFMQTISLEEGIRKTVKAYRGQNYQRGIDWRFDALWDAIIRNETRRRARTSSRLKTGFINYLGTATIKDRLVYFRAYLNCFLAARKEKGLPLV